MRPIYLMTILCLMTYLLACQAPDEGKAIFDKQNLVAWCVVPFDAEERNPEERASMLKDLGLSKLAYDYRDRHIPSFAQEIEVLKEKRIELSAVWLWIQPQGDEVLGEASRRILDILEQTATKTELWVGFSEEVFTDAGAADYLPRAVAMVEEVMKEAERIGCTIALYNHGGWFGEPQNQVDIIQALGPDKIKIVYNFHHAHHQVEDFAALLEKMQPYLSTINLNGMKVEGPKILPLGEGDREEEMLRMILDSGYRGPIGILGHTDGLDIKPVLEANLRGLEELSSRL